MFVPAAFSVGSVATILFLGGAFAAYRDGMLTVGQMRRRGIQDGLPFISHLGMWGDLLFITPILVAITMKFAGEWDGKSILVCSVVSLASSGGLHYLYVNGKLPSAHNRNGKLLPAGLWHVAYMGLAFTTLFLFYFATPVITPDEKPFLIMVSVGLVIHWFAGSQIPLGIWSPAWFSEKPHKSLVVWIQMIVITGLLGWRTYVMCH